MVKRKSNDYHIPSHHISNSSFNRHTKYLHGFHISSMRLITSQHGYNSFCIHAHKIFHFERKNRKYRTDHDDGFILILFFFLSSTYFTYTHDCIVLLDLIHLC
jgi:hypothetical protein